MIKKLRLAVRNELEAPAEARQFGSGWISGVMALILSIAGLLLFLSQQYPALFSMKELSVLHNNAYFLRVVQAILLLGFLLACINLVLRRNKVMGFSSIVLVLLTTLLGAIGKADLPGTPTNLSFDWFVLNLLLNGILFIPLEKLFGRLKDQPLFRTEWREDLFYFLFSSLLVQSLAFLSLAPAKTVLLYASSWSDLRAVMASQPLLLQIIEIMFLTDFVQYWFHRAFHSSAFLWRFHAVHHSAQKMDWLAGARMHIVEIVLLRGLTIIPMYALGFTDTAIYVYILFVYLNATFIHSNVYFNVEWIKPFVVTPRFHHWHHGIEKEAINVNFAIHFPWLDKLFGTYYMPPKQWPSGYGIGGQPVPNGYLKQFVYPFTPKKPVQKH
jgi:sterol desaturase/sphingolipid hydroxylase (fatty acid hydroxylase superfamily)